MGAKTEPVPLDEIRSLLREADLRVTAPRIAVLRALHAASAPLSHPELVELLSGESFDRATLYRNLIDLADAGLVSRNDHGDHVWRFELRSGKSATHDRTAHAHFVCDSCGDVQCLPADAVELHGARSAPRALRKKRVEVQLRGRCDDCDDRQPRR